MAQHIACFWNTAIEKMQWCSFLRTTYDARRTVVVTHDVRRTTHDLLSNQCHGYVTDNLERRRAHLVERILCCMPVRIIEVHNVDRMNPGLLQRHMIVRERVLHARNELAFVPALGGNPPHVLHHLRGERG